MPRLVGCERRTTASDKHTDTTFVYIYIDIFFKVYRNVPDAIGCLQTICVNKLFMCTRKVNNFIFQCSIICDTLDFYQLRDI